MNPTATATTRRFGRTIAIAAATVGIALGAAGLASAAQAALSSDDNPTPSVVSAPDDTTTSDATTTSIGDTTSSIDDNGQDTTESSVDSDDDATSSSIDDHGQDDDSSSSSSTPQALPEPFTKTYTSAGGSITVSWTGTAFTLDSVDPADGSGVEIHDQQWDRVRVDFSGAAKSRIEVRLNDDHGSIRVRIG